LLLLAALPSCGDKYPLRACTLDAICIGDECRDCEVVAAHAAEAITVETCAACQGADCVEDPNRQEGVAPEGCPSLPCVDGKVVVQACTCDADCAGVAHYCGQFTGPHLLCTEDDDI
jgi:hypothetical protein